MNPWNNKPQNQKQIAQHTTDIKIREKAYQIWLDRHARGMPGTSESDWLKAKRLIEQEQAGKSLRRIQRVLSWLNQPLIGIDRTIEPWANSLDKANLVRISEKISPLFEVIGVIVIPLAILYFTQTSEASKERQEKAVRAQSAVQNYLNQLSATLREGELESNERLKTVIRASN
ncbi:DUF2934 domain-containing protein [Leptolyngbya sp. GB1-A1]